MGTDEGVYQAIGGGIDNDQKTTAYQKTTSLIVIQKRQTREISIYSIHGKQT